MLIRTHVQCTTTLSSLVNKSTKLQNILCLCVVKKIRVMKGPSSIKYLDAPKKNKVDKFYVFVSVVH
jgi:hypothetical protein